MKNTATVFLGGGIGSVCRYLIAVLLAPFETALFPVFTFIANLLGCFVIGLLIGKVAPTHRLNLFLVTGFCGGFTTFSTFSKESMFLMQAGYQFYALFYVFSSVLLGLLLVWLGYGLTQKKGN